MKNTQSILLGVVSALLLSVPAHAHMTEECGTGGQNHEYHHGWHGHHHAPCRTTSGSHLYCHLGHHHGCRADSDGDRIPDWADHCPGSSSLATVNFLGCDVDSDGDGVSDHRDDCQHTPAGVKVDGRGCRLDTDRDGVIDTKDECAETRTGDLVNGAGCSVKVNEAVLFATGSAALTKETTAKLDALAEAMKKAPGMIMEVQGHTDWQGERSYNAGLGNQRAQAVKQYLIKRGIRPARLVATSFGDSRPRSYNADGGGQAKNRRVELLAVHNLSDTDGPTARQENSIR
ncbi:MAG: OmpA family protein [Magnetococcus sp. DMHC-8]